MPKKFNRAAPTSSTTSRKRVVAMAILRARLLKTSEGANPTSPRKTERRSSGLMTGSRALKANAKYLRTIIIRILRGAKVKLRALACPTFPHAMDHTALTE